MNILALFFFGIVLILFADKATRRRQPAAIYLVNAANLEYARPLPPAERLAQWSAAYYSGNHHNNPPSTPPTPLRPVPTFPEARHAELALPPVNATTELLAARIRAANAMMALTVMDFKTPTPIPPPRKTHGRITEN